MVKGGIFLKIFLGIFVGNFLSCMILITSKHEVYVRFWNYMGIVIFPILNLIIFMTILGGYKVIAAIFKINYIRKGFFSKSFLFSFSYTLGIFCFILPVINKMGRNASSLFEFYLIDPGIPYLFFPVLLFLIIFIISNNNKKQSK